MSTVLPPISNAIAQAVPPRTLNAHPALDAPDDVVFPVRRFSVAEYELIGAAGILTEDDSVELLEGLIVEKMTKNPRHDAMIDLLVWLLSRLLPLDWFPRGQNVLITNDSAPEPDVVVVHGDPQDFWNRHPKSADVALVIEVAETSLARDRRKRRIYARAGVVQYWIINLESDVIEMYAEPDQTSAEYARRNVVPLRTAVTFGLSEDKSITLPFDTAIPAPAN